MVVLAMAMAGRQQQLLIIAAAALSLLSATAMAMAAEEDRAHGLSYVSPMAVSPEAYAFFHPKTTAPTASTMPLAAATVKSTPAQQSQSTESASSSSGGRGGGGIGAGAIAGVCLSLILACVVGMGAFYIIKKRRANLSRAAQQPPVNV